MFILFTRNGGGQSCLFYLLGREEGYNVTSECSLIGASSRGCIIVSKGKGNYL